MRWGASFPDRHTRLVSRCLREWLRNRRLQRHGKTSTAFLSNDFAAGKNNKGIHSTCESSSRSFIWTWGHIADRGSNATLA